MHKLKPQTFPRIQTIRSLKEMFGAPLIEAGIQRKSIEILCVIFLESWSSKGRKTVNQTRATFRTSVKELDALTSHQLIRQDKNFYELTFTGFAVLVAFGKRAATGCVARADALLKYLRRHLDLKPDLHTLSLDELSRSLRCDEEFLFALSKIFGTSTIGIQPLIFDKTNGAGISFSESVFRQSNFLSFCSEALRWHVDQKLKRNSERSVSPDSVSITISGLQASAECFSDSVKAVHRIYVEPDSAISSAKSALDSAFKMIAAEAQITTSGSMTSNQLFANCRVVLGLEGDRWTAFVRAAMNLCNEVSELRNKFGDSHGKSPNVRKATRAEAQLYVAMSLSLANFVLQKWEEAQRAR